MWVEICLISIIGLIYGVCCFLWGMISGKSVDIRITNKKIRTVKKEQ